MHYTSPIPLLRYAGVDAKNVSETSLNKIQKGLLVELDLSEEKSLHVDGQVLTKDDILSILDDVKDSTTLLFHQWIYDSPYLLKLLQHKELNEVDDFFDLSLTYHHSFEGFKLFISPYLSQPLGKAINQAFLKGEFKKAQELLVGHYLITDAYFDETFGKLKNSLKAMAAEIKRTEQDVSTFKASHFTYINYHFINFLNALPDQLVGGRDVIVMYLINLSVKLQRVDFDFCYNLYQILKWVKCDEETKKLLFHNLDVFSSKRNKDSATKPVSGCFSIGIVVFVLMIAIRGCFSSSGTRTKIQQPKQKSIGITITELDYVLLKKTLKAITVKQLNSFSSDSLSKVWATHKRSIANDVWPYSNFTKNMKTNMPYSHKEVTLQNNSEYDAIVFLRNKENIYSAYLPIGKKLNTTIAKDDVLSLYIGKDWDRTKWFDHKSIARKMHLTGLFSTVDSTTLFYLDRYWKFTCSSNLCDSATVELTSPVKGSFQFNDNAHAFERLSKPF